MYLLTWGSFAAADVSQAFVACKEYGNVANLWCC
jgi:hypothetical protein